MDPITEIQTVLCAAGQGEEQAMALVHKMCIIIHMIDDSPTLLKRAETLHVRWTLHAAQLRVLSTFKFLPDENLHNTAKAEAYEACAWQMGELISLIKGLNSCSPLALSSNEPSEQTNWLQKSSLALPTTSRLTAPSGG